jgi:hypothetical protein
MKTLAGIVRNSGAGARSQPTRRLPLPSAGFLHLVTTQEVEALRDSLAEGKLPEDLQTKLLRLSGGSLLHNSVAQNSQTIISLLMATYHGAFLGATRADLDRLLRVLAYVRKENDATPDSLPGGYVDDQQEVRAVMNEMHDLFERFKAWRLRYQVPQLWLGPGIERA